MAQKIERVEYELTPRGRRVPAHPVFLQAFRALPNVFTRGPLGTPVPGRPWGVPAQVWVSVVDLEPLGIPRRQGLQVWSNLLYARILTTRTKKLGELPMVTEILAELTLPAGVIAMTSSSAHKQRDHLNNLAFWQWRCRAHEGDCLLVHELGVVCLDARGGPGFIERPNLTR